jgi:hypothetical protein
MTACLRLLLPVMGALLVLPAPRVHAGEWCFNSTSIPNPAPPDDPDILIVAQKFKTPKKGKCQVIVGYDVGTYDQTFARPVSGTACLDSAGTLLHVGAIIHVSAGADPPYTHDPQINLEMTIPFPALTGGRLHFRLGDAPTTTNGRIDVFAGPCQFGLVP